MWLCFINWKFEFQEIATSNKILKYQMISDEKVMNMKVVELIKIYNFYFGHIFMWLCLNNSKFEFQEMENSNNILKHQMISSKKSWIWKLYNSSRCTTFILVICSSEIAVVTLFIKFTSLSCSFINYKRDVWDSWIMLLPLCWMNKWLK